MASGNLVVSGQKTREDDEEDKGSGEKGMGVFLGAGLAQSIPVRSKRLELGFRRRVTLVLGTLGGGAVRTSYGRCRINILLPAREGAPS